MRPLRPVFFAAFFFAVHLALLTYLNSTMLERFGDAAYVSRVYTFAAALSLLVILAAPRIVRTLGLARTVVIALLASATLLIKLGTSTTAATSITYFVLYFSLNACIGYLFDLFVDHYSSQQMVGKIRGTYLMIQNIGWVIAPVCTGILVATFGISVLYIISAVLIMITLLIIGTSQQGFVDRRYAPVSIRLAFRTLGSRPILRRALTINLLLQLFFAWMVVYAPLYLISQGFGWKEIGLMFSIMLLPFVLCQYPAGRLADRIGELPLMRVGLLIASIATLIFGLVSSTSFVVFAAILFATRVGASIVEVGTDSYFFRQVTDSDSSIVGLYRTMLPLAYIIGPVLGTVIISLASIQTLFVLLSILLIGVMLYTIRVELYHR